jgi:dTMP kinase
MPSSRSFPGAFVVIEGLDGAGTTTQTALLVEWLAAHGHQGLSTREPTLGPFGAPLRLFVSRRLVAAPRGRPPATLDERAVALAFAADRLDHVQNEIRPALEDGVTVVADRYTLSSLAYQSLSVDYNWVKAINAQALRPDLTLFLSVSPQVCVRRMHARRKQAEIYEELSTLERIEASYHRAIADLRADGEQIHVVDGDRPAADVHADVTRLVQPLLAPG